MDCKMENAAVSVVRIEALVLQGMVSGLLSAAVSVLTIPLNAFVLVGGNFRRTKRAISLWGRLARTPLWLLDGLAYSLLAPFVKIIKAIVDSVDVAQVEWNSRWTSGTPKLPNGHPAPILSEEEKMERDAAITMSVIEDFNEEAAEFGQGLKG